MFLQLPKYALLASAIGSGSLVSALENGKSAVKALSWSVPLGSYPDQTKKHRVEI